MLVAINWMKKLVCILSVFSLIFGFSIMLVEPSALALNLNNWEASSSLLLAAEVPSANPADAKLQGEYGQKVDLNNANVRLFRQYRGFYPILAKKIVDNAPYENVKEVLDIPGLSAHQKTLLQANLDNFTVTETADVFNEGGDRYNPGYY